MNTNINIADAGAHVHVAVRPDLPGPPCVWFQPTVRGASMCLPLTADEARAIASALVEGADAITPRADASVDPPVTREEDEAMLERERLIGELSL